MGISATPAVFAEKTARLEPAKLGLLLFIAMEIMFFAGLISAFTMFRFNPLPWPPVGQPRLPVEVTLINSLVLLFSGFTLQWAVEYLEKGNYSAFLAKVQSTAWLGSLFLVVQGFEWVRLLHFGLTLSSGVYGGFFYALVGLHGIHVAGGLSVILWLWKRASRVRNAQWNILPAELCRMYWFFVVGLWPVLFILVYL